MPVPHAHSGGRPGLGENGGGRVVPRLCLLCAQGTKVRICSALTAPPRPQYPPQDTRGPECSMPAGEGGQAGLSEVRTGP